MSSQAGGETPRDAALGGSRKNPTVALLPGDGIGPEVTGAAREVLAAVLEPVRFETALVGGRAIDETGSALPDETLSLCRRADAILLGAVGGPKWSDPSAPVRPEQGLLRLRRELELFANLRPVPLFSALGDLTPLRSDLIGGVDLLIVRELTGGLYFGRRREQEESEDGLSAFDTMEYSVTEVERVAHVAFRAARERRGKVSSVDKANVLASMRLWRRTVTRIGEQYPDVELEHVLVDACAMHLITRPAAFDVILAGNLFGDILSDEASVLAGSLGLLPSASLGTDDAAVFEAVHGSAPDIAGSGKASPIGAILSAAMLLRHSLGRDDLAQRVEQAVARALERGVRTPDLGGAGSTAAMSEAVLAALDESG